ncbi:hypothetical protein IEO21_10490 [Rhodonia placenta]|uniref:Integrase catalytic domain-containing protein n=1 Tax=Rhodonia placenta TaxID=104341 RepID=A0A8H7TXH5_9APHY|nr:hypothetical protein IEO21_10490 [Postia placenta]
MSPVGMYEFQPDHHETTTSRIPKLNEDGSNWVLFKEQFVAAVSAKGLVRFLDGREKVPVPTTAPGVDPDADERYEAAQDIWVAKHQTIRTLLFQTLPEAIKLRIAPLQRASEAWKTVVDEYDDQGEFVQVELLRQMHALRCEENTDPRPTLNKLERLKSEYATAGASVQSLPKLSRILDSGASRHFDPCRENFETFHAITPKPISSADGRVFHATGEGNVRVMTSHNGKSIQFLLKDVLYAPSMPHALISISRAANAGLSVRFGKGGCHVLSPKGNTMFVVPERQGLYPILPTPVKLKAPHPAALTAATSLTLHELHCRMGHAYPPALKKMIQDGVVTGIRLENTDQVFCEICAKAKQPREPFPPERSSPQADHYGARVHTDVWGKAPIRTLAGKEYYVLFLDDHTDEAVVMLMSRKSDTFSRYKTYNAWVKAQRGVSVIQELQSDRGGEYISDEFSAYLEGEGTVRRLTSHDSPQQNGKAERLNRTVVEHARALLFDADLPKALWGEAVMHAVWLRNRTTTRNTPGSTPHERAAGMKPDLRSLPRFGSPVWVHVDAASKLDPKSRQGRWVGFDAQSKAHRIYWPDRHTVSIERDVRFADVPLATPITMHIPAEGEPIPEGIPNAPTPTVSSDSADQDAVAGQVEAEPPMLRRSQRMRNPSQWVQDLSSGAGTTGGRGAQQVPASILEHADLAIDEGAARVVDEPAHALAAMAGDEPTYREAMAGPECDDWKIAMQEELAKIEAMGTYELVEPPKDVNIVGSVWVLKKKRDEHNNVAKFKARLCAQGFSQVYGIDYVETAAPTASLSSLRLVLALAAANDWEIHQIDFKNAYLNGDLDETIYMRQPPGFAQPNREHWLWKLLKALYGLKQAGRLWYQKVCELLAEFGLTRSQYDLGVFFCFDGTIIIIIVIHVDDCTLVANSKSVMTKLKHDLGSRFEIVDLGELRWLLGFEVHRNRSARTISLSQASYIDTLLDRFGMVEAHTLTVPLDSHINLFDIEITNEDRHEMSRKPYARLVGSLMYAAIGTRPDIAFAVSTLARFMATPAPVHWDAAKRVLRYLKGTRDLRLTFGTSSHTLVGYSDADWASQPHRHSISGHVFLYSGGSISWSSRKQPIIALSTTEAEYISVSDTSREMLWLRSLLAELTSPLPTPTPLYSDNQSAITIAKSGMLHARTKHIDIRYHFIREVISSGRATLAYCPTDEMVADILTKPLVRDKVAMLAHLLGLRPA